MENLRSTLMILLGTMLVFSNMDAAAVATEDVKPADAYETDRVIVKVSEEAAAAALEDSNPVHTVEAGEEILASLEVPEDETLESFMEELSNTKGVVEVEPDQLIHLNNTSTASAAKYAQYHLQKIKADQAWIKTQGSKDVTVAVIDNGIDLKHPEFKGRIVNPYDAVTKSKSSMPAGEHGTHVAGIVGASRDNKLMGAGVAPNTSIMPINVFVGQMAYLSDILEGVYYAADQGAEIINMSLGSDVYSAQFDEAIQYAFSKGITIVAAAGNAADNQPFYPAAFENVISVSSITASDKLSDFSSYGKTVDITAPGSNILSTFPNKDFGEMSGTSMASPAVAGVAALLLASEPGLSNKAIAERLYSTADDLGKKGYDPYFGNGRVNAKKALNLKTLAAPKVDKVFNASLEITGHIPYEIKDGQVTVSNQAGAVVGKADIKKGPADFSVAIPKQKAGTVLYVMISDKQANSSDKLKIKVEKLDYQEKGISLLGHLKSEKVRIYKNFYNDSHYQPAGKEYMGHVYYIKKQVSSKGKIFYLISQKPSSSKGIVGWVRAEDVSVKSHKSVDKGTKTFLIKGTGSAYKKIWGGSKEVVLKDLSAYKNEKFKVRLTEKVGKNTWYYGELKGKMVWVHSMRVGKP